MPNTNTSQRLVSPPPRRAAARRRKDKPEVLHDACIYKITLAGFTYIGATRHYAPRMLRHRRELLAGLHHNVILQRTAKKYGLESFKSEVLEFGTLASLGVREQHFMDLHPGSVNIARVSSLLPGYPKYEAARSKPPVPGDPALVPAITPRPNQKAAEDALLKSLSAGQSRGLIKSPCGTGKTKLAAMLGQHFDRVLFVTHSDELVDGTLKDFHATWPGHHVGVIKQREFSINHKFTVASLMTLIRRLPHLDPGHFDLIVLDEAHLMGATAGVAVARHFEPRYLLGLTATPERTTGTPLSEIFGEVIYSLSVPDAIGQGLMSPVRGIDVILGIGEVGLSKITGDYDDREVEKAMNELGRPELIAEIIRREAGERQTLVYATTVKQARRLARCLGDNAEAVAGTDEDRSEKVKRYQAGQTQFLVSVKVIGYGFDAPATSCVALAVMTKSNVNYTQFLGRGMRISPGKTDTLIIDFGGNGQRGLTLEKDWAFEVEQLDPLQDRGGGKATIDLDLDWTPDPNFDASQLDVNLEEVDLLARIASAMRFDPSPATDEQKDELQAWGYRLSDSLSRRDANHLISAHPASPDILSRLKAFGFDTTTVTWGMKYAVRILMQAQTQRSA